MRGEDAWDLIRAQLQSELSRMIFEKYVRQCQFVALSDGVLNIGAPDEMTRAWLTSRLASTIRRQLTGIFGQPATVRFVVSQTPVDGLLPALEQTVNASLYERYVRPQQAFYIPAYLLRWLEDRFKAGYSVGEISFQLAL